MRPTKKIFVAVDLCGAEWAAHLHQVLPLLAIHDAARHLTELTPAYETARTALTVAVHTARRQPHQLADDRRHRGHHPTSAHERWV